MNLKDQHSFWGSLSPLGGLSGAGLLVMASGRLSWAIAVAGSLFWVYGLSVFTYTFLLSAIKNNILPVKGRKALFVCLASFWGSIYLLMFWLLCPFAALEVFVLLLMVPLFCAGSGIIEQITSSGGNSNPDIFDNITEAVSQAGILAGLLVALSIVREPLAYSSLSFPGTSMGMIFIFQFNMPSFFPIEFFTNSAGAFLLLGYSICLYQHSKNAAFPGDKQ
jgi:hypothetical protein